MQKPSLLKKGDRVGIVAPARKVSPVQVEAAIKSFQDAGFDVSLSRNLLSNSHSYLAATDNQRLADLQFFLDSPDIKAVICARGGYGSTRILERLDFSNFLENPKWLIGFSDVTAIHLKLLRLNTMSIHATMPILFSKPDSAPSIASLMTLLFEGSFALKASPSQRNRYGHSHGIAKGGNLSLIVDSLGTPSEIETDNCILILEEIDEYFYRLDRMMTQLKRGGKLDTLKGLVIGHMTDIKESELPFGETVEEIVLDKVKEYGYPVAFNFPTGHENPNLAWIQGENVSLSVGPEFSLLSNQIKSLQ